MIQFAIYILLVWWALLISLAVALNFALRRPSAPKVLDCACPLALSPKPSNPFARPAVSPSDEEPISTAGPRSFFPPRSKAGSHLPAGNSNVASTHNAGLGNQNPPGASPLVFSHRCAPGDFDFELQRTFWRLRDDILYGNLPDSTLARQQLQTLLAKHRYRQTP